MRRSSFWRRLSLAIAGMIVEATSLRPLYNKDPLLGLLLTFGLALFLQELIRTVWGARRIPLRRPAVSGGFIVYGPILVTKYRLAVLVLTILILIAVWLFLEKTPWGRIIRAGSRDPEMVSMLGINLRTIFTITFGLGTALAGVAGVLAAPLWSVVPSMADHGDHAGVRGGDHRRPRQLQRDGHCRPACRG